MWVLVEALFWMKIEFVLRSGINLLEFVLVEQETTANPSLIRTPMISYLVDPASDICLSQRLSHACLSINNFIL